MGPGDLTLQYWGTAGCSAPAARLDRHADGVIVRERLIRPDQHPTVAVARLECAAAGMLAFMHQPDLVDLALMERWQPLDHQAGHLALWRGPEVAVRPVARDGIPAHCRVVEQRDHRLPTGAAGRELSRLGIHLALERQVPDQECNECGRHSPVRRAKPW